MDFFIKKVSTQAYPPKFTFDVIGSEMCGVYRGKKIHADVSEMKECNNIGVPNRVRNAFGYFQLF